MLKVSIVSFMSVASNEHTKRNLVELQTQHETLLICMMYCNEEGDTPMSREQPLNQHHNRGSDVTTLAMSYSWFFDSIPRCFDLSAAVMTLNTAIRMHNDQVTIQESEVKFGFDNFTTMSIDDVFFMTSALQFSMKSETRSGLFTQAAHLLHPVVEYFWQKKAFRSQLPTICETFKIALEGRSPKAVFMFDSAQIDDDCIWEYIVETMMKQYLVYELYSVHESKPDNESLAEAIKRVYLKCLTSLNRMCKYRYTYFPKPGDALEKLYKEFDEILGKNHIPHEVRVNNQMIASPEEDKIIANVELWFSNFIICRTFGRRVATAALKPDQQTFAKQGTPELSWFLASFNNGDFTSTKFIEQCWKNDYTEGTWPDPILTKERVDSFFPMDRGFNSSIWGTDDATRSLKWQDLLYKKKKGGYAIKCSSLVTLVGEVYSCFHALFLTKSTKISSESSSLYLKPLSQKVVRGSIAEFWQRTKINRYFTPDPDFWKLAVSPMILPRRLIDTLPPKLGTPSFKRWDASTFDETLRRGCERIAALRKTFLAYQTRNTEQNEDGAGTDLRKQQDLHRLIKKRLGVALPQISESSQIPRDVMRVLTNLVSEKSYPHALESLMNLISKRYDSTFHETSFAMVECGDNAMAYWKAWPTIFEFFLDVLVVSLHCNTSESSEMLSSKTFSTDEMKMYVLPFQCYELLRKVYPDVLKTIPPEPQLQSYCLANLLSDLHQCKGTSMVAEQCMLYQWSHCKSNQPCQSKRVVEHILTLILILSRVKKFGGGSTYNDIIPRHQ
jgi:hypothetical protein